jgi:hypothetical protein
MPKNDHLHLEEKIEKKTENITKKRLKNRAL